MVQKCIMSGKRVDNDFFQSSSRQDLVGDYSVISGELVVQNHFGAQ